MRASGHTREAELLIHSEKTWIRRLATKYLTQYSKSW